MPDQETRPLPTWVSQHLRDLHARVTPEERDSGLAAVMRLVPEEILYAPRGTYETKDLVTIAFMCRTRYPGLVIPPEAQEAAQSFIFDQFSGRSNIPLDYVTQWFRDSVVYCPHTRTLLKIYGNRSGRGHTYWRHPRASDLTRVAFWEPTVRRTAVARLRQQAETLGTTFAVASRALRTSVGLTSSRDPNLVAREAYITQALSITQGRLAGLLNITLCRRCGARQCRCPLELAIVGGNLRFNGEPTDDWQLFTGCEVEVCGFTFPGRTNLRTSDLVRSFSRWICEIGGSVGTDGSLPSGGREIRLPPMRGTSGEAMLERLHQDLRSFGAWVGEAAGGHIHVDARDFSGRQLLNIARVWFLIQESAFSLWAPSRRSSRWCVPIGNPRDNQTWTNFIDNTGRYSALNPQAYNQHTTLEFRLFGPTVDGPTLLARSKAVSRFVQTAARLPLVDWLVENGSTAEEKADRNRRLWTHIFGNTDPIPEVMHNRNGVPTRPEVPARPPF